jgi:hypothetical protein
MQGSIARCGGRCWGEFPFGVRFLGMANINPRLNGGLHRGWVRFNVRGVSQIGCRSSPIPNVLIL